MAKTKIILWCHAWTTIPFKSNSCSDWKCQRCKNMYGLPVSHRIECYSERFSMTNFKLSLCKMTHLSFDLGFFLTCQSQCHHPNCPWSNATTYCQRSVLQRLPKLARVDFENDEMKVLYLDWCFPEQV